MAAQQLLEPLLAEAPPGSRGKSLGEAESVRPPVEHMEVMRHSGSGQGQGQGVGVICRGHIGVFTRRPDEHGRRGRGDQLVEGGIAAFLVRRVRPEEELAGDPVAGSEHRHDRVAEDREVRPYERGGVGVERGVAGQVAARGEPDHADEGRARGPLGRDLLLHEGQGGGMPRLHGVPDHPGIPADAAQPLRHRLALVLGMRGVGAAGQHQDDG